MGNILSVFSDATFKMAAWQPYWIFWFSDSTFSLALYIKSKFHWHITFKRYSVAVAVCPLPPVLTLTLLVKKIPGFFFFYIYIYTPPPQTKWEGEGILDIPPVCPSVCLLTFRVRPVASIVLDGYFPYLVQMIYSMRGCVACDDLWLWLISSRSFGLDLENRVCSVASTVLDGFFLYLAQMITIIRGCVTFFFFQNLEIWIFGKFLKFFGLDLENKIYSSRWILSIFSTNDHWYERVCCI